MVLAFRAFIKIFLEIFYRAGLVAILAFVPQSIGSLLFGFGGCLNAVPESLVPAFGFFLHLREREAAKLAKKIEPEDTLALRFNSIVMD